MKFCLRLTNRRNLALILGDVVSLMAEQGADNRVLVQFCLFGISLKDDFLSSYVFGTLKNAADEMEMEPIEKIEFWENLLKHDQGAKIVNNLAIVVESDRGDESIGRYWMEKCASYPHCSDIAMTLAESWEGQETEIRHFWKTMGTLFPNVPHFAHFLAESHDIRSVKFADACIEFVRQDPLAPESSYFLQHAVIYCPNRDELVSLAGLQWEAKDPTFNEEEFWKLAIGALQRGDSWSRSWYRLRIMELYAPLKVSMHQAIQPLNDVVDDLYNLGPNFDSKILGLSHNMEDDVDFWTLYVEGLMKAMKAKRITTQGQVDALKSWVSHHLSASTATESFLSAVDSALFPHPIHHFERLGFWASQQNVSSPVAEMLVCPARVDYENRDGYGNTINAWKWFFANASVLKCHVDRLYDPIIDNYALRVDLAGDDLNELRTVWRDAHKFCVSQLSTSPNPPDKLKRFHEKVCAYLKVIEI